MSYIGDSHFKAVADWTWYYVVQWQSNPDFLHAENWNLNDITVIDGVSYHKQATVPHLHMKASAA